MFSSQEIRLFKTKRATAEWLMWNFRARKLKKNSQRLPRRVNNTISILAKRRCARFNTHVNNYDVVVETAIGRLDFSSEKEIISVSIVLRMHRCTLRRAIRDMYPRIARFLRNVFVTITRYVALHRYRKLIAQTGQKARRDSHDSLDWSLEFTCIL